MEEGTTYNRQKTMCISDTGIIELDGMEFHAFHGCLERERREGNLFIVDFRGEADLRKAAGSDALEDTVNYGDIYDIIKAEIKEEFDLVFIDANKQEYIKFFEAVHPLLKKGGVILADNITSHANKVQDFVEAISSHEEYQVQILDLPDGLLMAYKKEV